MHNCTHSKNLALHKYESKATWNIVNSDSLWQADLENSFHHSYGRVIWEWRSLLLPWAVWFQVLGWSSATCTRAQSCTFASSIATLPSLLNGISLMVHCINCLQDIMSFNINPEEVGCSFSSLKSWSILEVWCQRGIATKWRRIHDKPNNIHTTLLAWGPQNESLNPQHYSWQSSWGSFYKLLVEPYWEYVINVWDGIHEGAIQLLPKSEV